MQKVALTQMIVAKMRLKQILRNILKKIQLDIYSSSFLLVVKRYYTEELLLLLSKIITKMIEIGKTCLKGK